MFGVNGSGKTTTIGKLARQMTDGGLSVMLAAGDTFRAAAVEQLETWGERNNVAVVAQGTGADSTAPHETLIVLDGGTGQNALTQAQQFHEAIGLTGMAVTKLDGTAKGGVVFAIAENLGLPIRFIGVGEGVFDLQVFEAEPFIDALVDVGAPADAA